MSVFFPRSKCPCAHCWRLPSGGHWCWRCCWVVGHSSAQPAIPLHVNPNHCGSAPCPRAPVTCTSPSSSLIDSNRLLGPQHHRTRVAGPRCFLFCCGPSAVRCGSIRECVGLRPHQRTSFLLRRGCFVVVLLLAVRFCRFGAWVPSLCSRTHHHPDRPCARRYLQNKQLSGSLPSWLGSLTGLSYLYVVVLSVSASARGATNALVFSCGTVFVFFFFLLLAVLLCRVGAWLPSLCSRTHAPPRWFVRAQVP